MAKLDQVKKEFRKFTDKLQKIVVQAKSSKEVEALAEFVVDLIVKRSRLGYGITRHGGEKVKFPELSENYVLMRKKNRGSLDSTTSAKKSNVTYTGQLLRSLGYRRRGKSGFIVQAEGSRDEGGTNEEVAYQLLKKRNRKFIGLTRSEERQVARFYRTQFNDVIRRNRG